MIKAIQNFALFTTLLSAASSSMAIEEPDFKVIATIDGIEYRHYSSYLVAETLVSSAQSRNKAANTGFRRLFNYISGDNLPKQSIKMTAPVQQQPLSQKIAMTAPVQQRGIAEGWIISFVVPKNFDLETVPVPTNPDVSIKEIPARIMAVNKYSGRWTDMKLNKETEKLLNNLNAAGVRTCGDVMSAAYNAPFVPPFMRRNEVMVEIDRIPQQLADSGY